MRLKLAFEGVFFLVLVITGFSFANIHYVYRTHKAELSIQKIKDSLLKGQKNIDEEIALRQSGKKGYPNYANMSIEELEELKLNIGSSIQKLEKKILPDYKRHILQSMLVVALIWLFIFLVRFFFTYGIK